MNYQTNLTLITVASMVAIAGLLATYHFLSTRSLRQTPSVTTISSTATPTAVVFEAAYKQNDFSAANAMADKLLARNRRDVSALLMKANVLAQQASLQFKEKELGDEAMNYVVQALAIDPTHPQAYLIQGYIHEIQQDYRFAYQSYGKAIELEPNFAAAYAQRGHAEQLQGKTAQALTDYQQALSLDRDNALALFGTAKIQATAGKLQEAKTTFLKVASLPTTSRQRAESVYSVGAITEALSPTKLLMIQDYADQAIALDPTLPQAYVLSGKTQFAQGMASGDRAERAQLLNKSYASLTHAIELDPNLAAAHFQLALQLINNKRTKDARLVLSGLTSIVDRDITLSSDEKTAFHEAVAALRKDGALQ